MDTQIKALRDEIARLIANDKKRQKETDELSQITEKQSITIEQLIIENNELRNRLAYYENPNTPPSMRSLEYKRQKREQREKKTDAKPPGSKKGHVGTSHHRKAIRTVEKKITVCKCGSTNLRFEKINQKLVTDFKPAPVYTENHIFFKSHCNDCNDIMTLKSIPSELGPNLLIEIITLWDGRASIDKITEIINTNHKTQFCPATIQHGLDAVAASLEPQYTQIKKDVQNNDISKNIDETVMPINGKRGYVWGVSTKEKTCFVVSASRGGAVLMINFPDIKSKIVSDGYSVYKSFSIRQHCWAHILNEAKFLSKDAHLKSLHESLLDVFEYAKSIKTDVKQIRQSLETRIMAIGDMYLQRDEKFGGKLQNAAPNLFTFMEHPDMEPTNNRAERALRSPVIHRKVRGQLRTSGGMRMFSILMSCLYTWRMQGKSIWDELFTALTAA